MFTKLVLLCAIVASAAAAKESSVEDELPRCIVGGVAGVSTSAAVGAGVTLILAGPVGAIAGGAALIGGVTGTYVGCSAESKWDAAKKGLGVGATMGFVAAATGTKAHGKEGKSWNFNFPYSFQ